MQAHVNPPSGGDETLRRLRAAVEGLGLTGSGERQAQLDDDDQPPADEEATDGTPEPTQGCVRPLP